MTQTPREAAEAMRETAVDECESQAADHRILQERYAVKFGGHSFEQQKEGYAALCLEELVHGLRALALPAAPLFVALGNQFKFIDQRLSRRLHAGEVGVGVS